MKNELKYFSYNPLQGQGADGKKQLNNPFLNDDYHRVRVGTATSISLRKPTHQACKYPVRLFLPPIGTSPINLVGYGGSGRRP